MLKNAVQSSFVLCLAVVGVNNGVAETIYKCKNQQGILVYQNAACKIGAETVNAWEQKPKASPTAADTGEESATAAATSLKLSQHASGHYLTDGTIDGKSLNFVVDTGASFVSLPEEVAHGANIYCDNKINMATANGNVDACTAKIKELKFGPYVIKNIAAVIVPNLKQPLLGMNVLQLFSIAQGKGEMQISILKPAQNEGK